MKSSKISLKSVGGGDRGLSCCTIRRHVMSGGDSKSNAFSSLILHLAYIHVLFSFNEDLILSSFMSVLI